MPDSKGPYNFTEEVRSALEDARSVAVAASSPCVQPIHVLHSLLKGAEAARVLSPLVQLVALRTAVATSIGAAPRARTRPNDIYSSRCLRVLQNAMAEARGLGHSFVGTEHLLLGILRTTPKRRLFGILPPSPDPAYAVLVAMGVTYDVLRATVGRAA
jgi:ATP-dependent Clp protease ATP-binding subunit ClpA